MKCMNCGSEKIHNIVEYDKRISAYDLGFEERKKFLEFIEWKDVEWVCCGRCCLSCKRYNGCFSS